MFQKIDRSILAKSLNRESDPGCQRHKLECCHYTTQANLNMLEPGFGPGLPAPQAGVLPITPFERSSLYISKMKPTGVEPITFGVGIRRAAVAPRSRDMCKRSAGTRDRTFAPFWRSRSAPTGIRTRAASATNWSAAVLHHWSSIDIGPKVRNLPS